MARTLTRTENRTSPGQPGHRHPDTPPDTRGYISTIYPRCPGVGCPDISGVGVQVGRSVANCE